MLCIGQWAYNECARRALQQTVPASKQRLKTIPNCSIFARGEIEPPPGGPEIQFGALPVEHNRSARGVALLQCIQARMTFSENFKISIINFRAISEDKGLKF